MTERAERELSHMRDQQEVCQTRVSELGRELSRLMNEITRQKKEHGDLTQLKIKLLNSGIKSILKTSELITLIKQNCDLIIVIRPAGSMSQYVPV